MYVHMSFLFKSILKNGWIITRMFYIVHKCDTNMTIYLNNNTQYLIKFTCNFFSLKVQRPCFIISVKYSYNYR